MFLSSQKSSPPEIESPREQVGSEMGAMEVQVVDLFVRGVKVLGLPRSVGEIYGCLFISSEALALDALVARLNMSKGSASQGLKFLRNLGAVRLVYVPGDRRDHYEAQTELKQLVKGFINGELAPHLESGAQRLDQLRTEVENDRSEHAKFRSSRVAKLTTWQGRGNELLKLIEQLLS